MYNKTTKILIALVGVIGLILMFIALLIGSNPIGFVIFVFGFQSESKHLLDDFASDIIFFCGFFLTLVTFERIVRA